MKVTVPHVAAFTLIVAALMTKPASAGSLFSNFQGSWQGGGTISLADQSEERIRCRAAYGVRGDGNALSVDVNCASDSYRVHIIANAVAQGDTLSGTWQETTRQVSGDVTGRIPAPGEIQATFVAMGGGLQLSARADGRRQNIVIRSEGTDVRGVTISLRR